jgi:hypothetical protein
MVCVAALCVWCALLPGQAPPALEPASTTTSPPIEPSRAVEEEAVEEEAVEEEAVVAAPRRIALQLSPALSSWQLLLVRRLLDEGFVVGGPAITSPSHRSSLDRVDGGVVLVVQGETTKVGVVAPGPAALEELEASQRLVSLVLELAPMSPSPPTTTTTMITAAISTDTVSLRLEPPADDDLAGLAVAAIIEAGLALAPAGTAPEVCVRIEDEGLQLGRAAGSSAACGEWTPSSSSSLASDLESVFRPRAPPPSPPPPSSPAVPVSPPRLRVWSPWTVAGAGGVIVRGASVDPLLGASGARRLGSVGGVGVDVVFGLMSSGSVGPLTVVEPLVSGGLIASVPVVDDVRLSAGLQGGAALHGYWFEDDVGLAADGAVWVPVAVTLPVADGLACQLGLAGGLSTRARSHQIDHVEVWQRGNAFVMLSVGLAFSLPGADPGPEKTDALARGDG